MPSKVIHVTAPDDEDTSEAPHSHTQPRAFDTDGPHDVPPHFARRKRAPRHHSSDGSERDDSQDSQDSQEEVDDQDEDLLGLNDNELSASFNSEVSYANILHCPTGNVLLFRPFDWAEIILEGLRTHPVLTTVVMLTTTSAMTTTTLKLVTTKVFSQTTRGLSDHRARFAFTTFIFSFADTFHSSLGGLLRDGPRLWKLSTAMMANSTPTTLALLDHMTQTGHVRLMFPLVRDNAISASSHSQQTSKTSSRTPSSVSPETALSSMGIFQ